MSPLEALAAGTATDTGGVATSEPIISITPEALEQLFELRDDEPEAAKLGLRVAIASAAGEEFRYDLSFDEFLKAAFTDEVRTHDGMKVIIPGADVELLEGATLDYTSTQGLVIRNPNRPKAPVIEGLISDDALSAEVEAMVAGEVNPALAAHGGFVTYVGHDGAGDDFRQPGGHILAWPVGVEDERLGRGSVHGGQGVYASRRWPRTPVIMYDGRTQETRTKAN